MEESLKKWIGSFGAFLLVAVAPLLAQVPKGWMVHVNRSTVASDPDAAGDLKFTVMRSTFHIITPQAAILWNPKNVITGTYTLKGTFKLIKSTGYYEYFGLIFGGSDLQGVNESYVYFMVNDDGTWLVKRRSAMSADEIGIETSSPWVKRTDLFGNSTNALEVRVMRDTVAFVINGTVVNTMPKTGPLAKTDGIYGIRSNHRLELEVEDFGVSK